MLKTLDFQRRCVGIVAGLGHRDCCEQTFIQLTIMTVSFVYILNCLMFVKKHLPAYTTHSYTHEYNTRHKNKLDKKQLELSIRDGPNFIRITLFNTVLDNLVVLRDVFKSKIRVHLKSAFYNVDIFY